MSDTASISALLSASAVVGALTTSQIVTWYVESAALLTDVKSRSGTRKTDDEYTRRLKSRHTEMASKQRALLWVAGIQWAVVAALVFIALCLSNPWRADVVESGLVPFFAATAALLVALVVVPAVLVGVATRSLHSVASVIGPPARPN